MDKKEPPIIKRHDPKQPLVMKIPICCREGHDDCIHRVRREKPKKQNIGL